MALFFLVYFPAYGQVKKTIDTTALINAFNIQLKPYAQKQIKMEPSPKTFLAQGLQRAIKREHLYKFLRNDEPVIAGDLNGDKKPDVLVPFTIEGRGDGNNWDLHYAILVRHHESYQLKTIFDCGGDLARRITYFKAVKNDTIKGIEKPGTHFPDLSPVPVHYVLKNGALKNISTDEN